MSDTLLIDDLSIYLENVSVTNGDHLVLENVNLSIVKGSFHYLIGRTGSGKTSLIRTLYAARPLAAGVGHIAGFDLNAMTFYKIPQLRRRLGIVFQEFNLIDDLTVNENLAFVLKSTGWKRKQAIDQRVAETLEKVRLMGYGDKYPYQISGGERQRLVIGRALVNQPELIIADEPTGNLDPETADEIMLLMLELNAKYMTTILFATHDYNLLTKFPQPIIECLNGTIELRPNIELS